MGLTYGSLFTGIGGFDFGFDRSGMRGEWQIERDKDCNRVLGKQWPGVQRGTDVCEVTKKRFGAVDVICGGFPCQDVSVAGKRAGLAGARSGLWSEFHRIIEEFTPRFAVIENVPGLFSSHGGLDFLTIIRGLAQLGYCIGWTVLDSQYRGVAQRRDRVFIVGSLGNGSCAEILFESESLRGDSAPSRESRKEIAGTIGGSSQSGGFRTTDLDNNGAFVVGAVSSKWAKGSGGPAADECQNLIAHSLSAEGADASEDGTGRGTTVVCAPLVFDERVITSPGNRSEVESGKPCPTLNGGIGMTVAIPIQEIRKRQSGTSMNGVGHGKDGDPMFTLQRSAEHGVAVAFTERNRAEGRTLESQEEIAYALTNPGSGGRTHSRKIAQGMSVRRLTPRECERLQGFPDDWTRWDATGKEISDSVRYRMLGNAVTTTQAEWIGNQLMKFQ